MLHSEIIVMNKQGP